MSAAQNPQRPGGTPVAPVAPMEAVASVAPVAAVGSGASAPPPPRSLRIAVLALGGQGGGVLVDWIVDLAEHAGWTAQSTSVAGVAQRTGATVYYVELVEPTPGRTPVMALMPVPGDVDVLIAAELMEAGRAVERGLVTPERTLLIASSHRSLAVQEKIVPGNGLADAQAVAAQLQRAARRLVLADMQALAQQHGSVISASLFGALAGSGALPFAEADFEAVVQRAGVGVQPSLRALRAAAAVAAAAESAAASALGAAVGSGLAAASTRGPASPCGPGAAAPAYAVRKRVGEAAVVTRAAVPRVLSALSALPALASPATWTMAPRPLPAVAAAPALQPLLERIRAHFAPPAWDWLGEGLARVVDWQDLAYGGEYLGRVAALAVADDGRDGHALTVAAAHWIAVAMSYDDVIRVAELKSRLERSARVRAEIGAQPGDVFGSQEYFHPRLAEALGLLPHALAERVAASPRLVAWLTPRLDRGRRLHAQTLRGHLQLRLLAGLRRWRRGNHRHALELQHLQAWLDQVQETLRVDPALAVEELRCRRLVKGYSDTHLRGSSRFARLLGAARQLRGRPDAAPTLAALARAALQDATGAALAQALRAQGLPGGE